MSAEISPLLVFSDLDGSLLDHYSYSFQEAVPAIRALERHGIPLIVASSKTRAEIVELRNELGNNHPFIVENGAAVFIPQRYFPHQPEGTDVVDEFWVHATVPSRHHWLAELRALEEDFAGEFMSFHSAGVAGIMAMTGLTEHQAANANNRHYSEPVKWLGHPQQETDFIQRLQDRGATVVKGGRFLSVSGSCDKGKALHWLRARYQETMPCDTIKDLAAGDSENDRLMLEAAATALVIRSPVHDFPALAKVDGVIRSKKTGPAGWAEGVLQWLALNGY
ncbi:MAG: HAD-IIB family hydrolase [Halioglobus sp.]